MGRIPAQRSSPVLLRPTAHQLTMVRDTLAAIPMAAVAHTIDFELVAANEDCLRLLHLTPTAVLARPVRDFIPAADRFAALEAAQAVMDTAAGQGRPTSTLRRLIDGNGQELSCWLHVGMATISGFRCFVACIDLVNPVLSDAHRWRHRAEHDELTGLRRRGALLGQLGHWVKAGRRVVVAFLDIDHFKSINDTHGHAAGDHVLTTLARRLEQHSPPGALVGRLSGDEFVLALSLVDAVGRQAEPDEASSAPTEHDQAEAIRSLEAVGPRCAAEPIAWGEHLLTISISAGITAGLPGEDPSSLLERADNAMYAQKSTVARLRR